MQAATVSLWTSRPQQRPYRIFHSASFCRAAESTFYMCESLPRALKGNIPVFRTVGQPNYLSGSKAPVKISASVFRTTVPLYTSRFPFSCPRAVDRPCGTFALTVGSLLLNSQSGCCILACRDLSKEVKVTMEAAPAVFLPVVFTMGLMRAAGARNGQAVYEKSCKACLSGRNARVTRLEQRCSK